MQRPKVLSALSIAAALAFATGLGSGARAAPPKGGESVLDANVERQIAELGAAKRLRTPAQKKVSPQLLYAAKMAKGLPITASVAKLETGTDIDASGGTEVEIRANVTARTLQLVNKLGGNVIRSHAFAKSIRARMPIDKVEELAADPDILFVFPPPKPATNRMVEQERKRAAPPADAVSARMTGTSERTGPPSREQRQALVRARLEQALGRESAPVSASIKVGPLAGAVVSEGDVTHRANLVRSTYGINGTGIKIGVLSDSFDATGGYAADVLAGELPGPGNPNGYTTPVQLVGSGDSAGGADEGRAMLQIIHDLAPGAQLYFATAFNSIEDFAANIYALRAAGCDIIVDDVFYYVESALHAGQSGVTSEYNMAIVTQAVNDVVRGGGLYFSSAGNQGNRPYQTATAWEGDFVAAGYSATVGGWVLDFDKSPAVQGYNRIEWGYLYPTYILQWADPLGASTNDFDLYMLDSTGTSVLAVSDGVQDGTQDPLEGFSMVLWNDLNRLVVVSYSAVSSNVFLNLSAFGDYIQFTTGGQIRGHMTALGGFGVAAAPAAATFAPDPPGIPTPPGPFPAAFNPGSKVEWFTSEGYRRVFFNELGDPITPGNFSELLNGGDIFLKPDITAADGTMTTVPPYFMPFYGTSAAAPHAAAIAALVKAAKPSLTPGQVRNLLVSTAIDIESPGPDAISGHGIVDAFAAVTATGAQPVAVLRTGTIVVTEVGGNGNLIVEPGESGTISVQLVNDGAVAATAITSVLSSVPGVTITAASSAYPNIAPAGSATNTTLFAFTVSPSYPCGQPIPFTLTVSFTGGLSSPAAFGFTAPTAAPIPSIAGNMSGTAPTPGTGYTTRAYKPDFRLFRDGSPTTCAAEPFPGNYDGGYSPYRSHVYIFKNASASATCVQVTATVLTSNLHLIGYVGMFDPADLSLGYAGDIGSSAPGSFSFTVPGGSDFSVVVIENFGAVNDAYAFTLSGVCLAPVPPLYAGIAAAGQSIVADQCPAGGNAILEPGEQATVALSLQNVAPVATNGNLIATLLENDGVRNPGAAQNYGVLAAGATGTMNFTFKVANGWRCGDTLTLTLDLVDGSGPLGTVTFTFPTGALDSTPTAQNHFDALTPPEIPPNWSTSASGTGVAWVTTATGAVFSAPNVAFTPNKSGIGEAILATRPIHVSTPYSELHFRQSVSMETGYDGGVLEISIDGGPFVDIVAAGGSFLKKGYNGSISTSFGNPLAGRSAWTGNSGGFIKTEVALPASTYQTTVVVRWRVGFDSSVAASDGWRIDNVKLFDTILCGGRPQVKIQQPLTRTLCTGSTLTLFAKATGQEPLTYQWRKNGINLADGGRISGVSTATLTVNLVNGTDTGLYDVVVTADCPAPGTTDTSAPANITVQTTAYTSSVTGPSTLCVGQSATASVTTNAPSATYFWSVTGFTGLAEIVGPANGTSVVVKGTFPGRVVLEATVIPAGGGCTATAVKEITVVATPSAPVITAPSSVSAGATGLVASVPSNTGSTYSWTIVNGTITSGEGTASITFTAGTGGTLTLTVTETTASCGAATSSVTIPVTGAGGPCVANATTLCLNLQRFEVKVDWKKTDGTTGAGQAVPFAPAPPDSGYFWFFESSNMELIIKVLDGRPVNGKFWVMFGALSDVEYTITIRDAQTGAVKTYHNDQGTMASVADVYAFSDSGALMTAEDETWSRSIKALKLAGPVSFGELLAATQPPAPKVAPERRSLAASGCTPDATTLCLNGGRFQANVDWDVNIPIGTYGPGRSVPVTTDTGCFWFFNDRNIELAVKVLDGTGVNGKFWVFYGALSDVHYVLTVTDTVTGNVKVYENPRGVLASVADTLAFTP